MKSLIGKKITTKQGVVGVVTIHERDVAEREVIRIKVIEGNTAVTDYFVTDIKEVSE